MALEFTFYLASGHAKDSGVVGGIPTGSVVGSGLFGHDLDLDDIIAPAKGDGFLYVYSKHYLNITELDGATGAENVRICFTNATLPDQLQLAASLHHNDYLDGGSHHYGIQTGLDWNVSGEDPSFVPARGFNEAVLLTNGSGDQGNVVGVTDQVSDSCGFWLKRRFTENIQYSGQTGQNFVTIGVAADPV